MNFGTKSIVFTDEGAFVTTAFPLDNPATFLNALSSRFPIIYHNFHVTSDGEKLHIALSNNEQLTWIWQSRHITLFTKYKIKTKKDEIVYVPTFSNDDVPDELLLRVKYLLPDGITHLLVINNEQTYSFAYSPTWSTLRLLPISNVGDNGLVCLGYLPEVDPDVLFSKGFLRQPFMIRKSFNATSFNKDLFTRWKEQAAELFFQFPTYYSLNDIVPIHSLSAIDLDKVLPKTSNRHCDFLREKLS